MNFFYHLAARWNLMRAGKAKARARFFDRRAALFFNRAEKFYQRVKAHGLGNSEREDVSK